MADDPNKRELTDSQRFVRSYRAREATLLDLTERRSIPTPTVKDRFLLTVLTGPGKGAVFKLDKDVVTLGRSDEADIALPDPGLSRIHARFLRAGLGPSAGYLVEDCDSTNGTYVDKDRIERPTPLEDGVRLGFGKRTLARFARQDALEEQAIVSVHESALRDALTKAYNRRVFNDRLQSELAFSVRHGQPLALLLLDIDHFKTFNDHYGHQAGDQVLIEVARAVSDTLRVEDLFARYGGEEFAVLVRDTPPLAAKVVAERIRSLIEKLVLDWHGQPLRVTTSIGVAGNDASPIEPEELLRQADAALYAAKERGRNQVVMSMSL